MKRFTIIIALIVILTAAQVASAQNQNHTVRPGETLNDIATLYNVEAQTIAAANNIANLNSIQAGQVLVIPPSGTTPTQVTNTYTVQPGDTMRAIAERFNTTVDALAQANRIATPSVIFPGEVLALPATGGPVVNAVNNVNQPAAVTQPQQVVRQVVNGRYTVQRGDTLFQIGRSFNVDIYDIARANGLLNLNHIFVGQSLVIPGR